MHHISKTAILPYSCLQMFNLIIDINSYHQFLNWCSDSGILTQVENKITAYLMINKSLFKQKFITLNTLTPNNEIIMELVDGPFKELYGKWSFLELNDTSCKIIFELKFSFKSKFTDLALAPTFRIIANSQLDAFVIRAKHVYG